MGSSHSTKKHHEVDPAPSEPREMTPWGQPRIPNGHAVFMAAVTECLNDVANGPMFTYDFVDVSRAFDDRMEICYLHQGYHYVREARLAVEALTPHMMKYLHVLRDFYEESGEHGGSKWVGPDVVEMFKIEPEFTDYDDKLKEHLLKVAPGLVGLHLDCRGNCNAKLVRSESTAFVRSVTVSEDQEKLLLIRTRSLAHHLHIIYEAWRGEGRTDEEFQANAPSQIDSLLNGINPWTSETYEHTYSQMK